MDKNGSITIDDFERAIKFFHKDNPKMYKEIMKRTVWKTRSDANANNNRTTV